MECFREAAYTKRLGVEKEVAAPCLLQGMGGWGAGRGRLHLEAGYGEGSSRPLPSPRGEEGEALRWPAQSRRFLSHVRSRSLEEQTSTTLCAACATSRSPRVSPPCWTSEENKENCPMTLGKPAEAAESGRLFATHQIRQCSQAS